MICTTVAPLLRCLTIGCLWLVIGLGWPEHGLRAAEPRLDFNRDIRPILSENCFYCHGQDANKRQAELRLDRRDDAIAKQALVPGDLDASELIQRIRSTNPDEVMPPPNSNRRLTDAQKIGRAHV